MIEIDLHCHSNFSLCGLHTFLELLNQAKSLGMKGLAITDHGHTLGGHLNSVFFERLKDPVPGIKLLKGIECNLLEEKGQIDLPRQHLKYMDIVLMGIHPNIKKGQGKETYTDMLIKAMEHNPEVDIITHPNDTEYPVDYDMIAKYANKFDKIVEINNSKNLLNRVTDEETEALICSLKSHNTRVAINSDTHAIGELGLDDSVRPLLAKHNFPEKLIVNSTAESTFNFIEERRSSKPRT